ncbi:MAG: YybH family protein [Gemmatimonadota bacterium]
MLTPRLLTAVMLPFFLLSACDEAPISTGPANESESETMVQSATGSPRDRDAIQQIVNTFDQTWGVDAATYAGQYAGADFVGPNGANLTTAQAILQLYTGIFPAFAGTTRQSQIRALTFLTGTIAVLDIDARVTGALPPFVTPWQPGIGRALEKNVLIKRAGEWRIVQHQQVLVAPGVE